ncbi:hypothetical protein ACET3Z_027014 [Daucus carota]
MGRAPCCDKANVKRGPWSSDEDAILKSYIQEKGVGGNWIALPQKIGLKRCGKSCRLRWLNYLRPNIRHGGFSNEEDDIICALYMAIGSRWSIIAAQLPGRTDNDIKNYWNTKLKKKLLGKQRKEAQEAARRSNTTNYATNIMIKSENNYMIPEATTHQYSYWPQHQLPMDSQLPAQLQNNLMNTSTSDLRIHDTISSIPFGEQLYDNSEYTNITSDVSNYMDCFQLPNPLDFQGVSNFVVNENHDTSVYNPVMNTVPCGVDKVNGCGGNDATTSAESTISWGGEMNSFVCSPVNSIISYDVDYAPRGMCGFEDQQPYLGFQY